MKRLARKFSRALSNDTAASSMAAATMAGGGGSAAAAEEAECLAAWGVSLSDEWQLVAQLREETELEAGGPLQPEFDDFVLRRFLRARKHNILKAKEMFIEQLKWREDSGVDTVLTDFEFSERVEFSRWYPEGFFGVDREGRPVYLQMPGKIDTVELWKFTSLERCIRHHLQQQERYWRIIAPCASLACGALREQSLVIIDMDGVGISTLTGEVRKIMGQIMQIDQDYYPELMWKCVIINAPTTFRVIWSMIRYLLDAHTQEKIEVLGADYQAELLRLIEPQHLMECYGGSNPAPFLEQPGPWKDPAVLSKLYAQRAERLAKLGKPEGMTWPPLPPGAPAPVASAASAGAGGSDDSSAEVAAAALAAQG